MRIGTGWDVHRLAEGRKFILGGILIPCERGEVAHSDGDVLVHAIIDAILGALAEGDIGSHFPDTDPALNDVDSLQLLTRVIEEDLPPYSIENIDTTVIVQRPKLREHIDAIRENLARVMHLEISQVSVKAKTAEGLLGELGTAEAVIAQAVVLISHNPC
ncbi:MAG: 2-C-methyl-D-erythritol 2,4-cyclodiphosphate synthase [Sphaerochaeta sp.]|jgi:2-C-methyl-D-erythritol 2,4-cyclodiphosphate synthase|nr:2-C-methyl-D-erythritol 2,4-cyclodiphosphate synthase [Spirochaetaceae bacterium]MDK2859533.1 2-C-methyl-D-erythritol 2,4-cyclodiphosphate synthase [Sphaerochaeta sp.]MDN5334540.1 2-C-methyl-D-erythritol 2,4-cyclodiphosphate synthase [Sphaerochaeta sp.]